MKALVVLLLLVATAHADKAAVDKLVRTHLSALTRRNVLADDAATKTLAKDAWLIATTGQRVKGLEEIEMFPQTGTDIEISSTVASLAVSEPAGHAAWFHAVVEGKIVWKHGNATKPLFRVSGIAVDDHGWKLAAVIYSRALPDKVLMAAATPSMAGDGVVADEDQLTKAFVGMFPSALGVWIGPGAIANGTAPTELATGRKVAALVGSWDKVGLHLNSAKARAFGDGGLAFAYGDVWLRGAKAGTAVPLVVGAILVPGEGNKWQWVSLNFATPVPVPD